jgi:hypothetical protein
MAEEDSAKNDSSMEAKQLDSVTDMVDEQELDASKVQQAMNSLSSAKTEDDGNAAALAAVVVTKEDIATVVNEMEVTEETADKVLREAAIEGHQDRMLEAALRKLVTS